MRTHHRAALQSQPTHTCWTVTVPPSWGPAKCLGEKGCQVCPACSCVNPQQEPRWPKSLDQACPNSSQLPSSQVPDLVPTPRATGILLDSSCHILVDPGCGWFSDVALPPHTNGITHLLITLTAARTLPTLRSLSP